MTACPSSEKLAELLDERLDEEDLSVVEAHLESCSDCQQTLEALTEARFSDPDWSGANDPLRPAVAPRAGLGGAALGDPDAPSPLDSSLQMEEDARRKRLILDRSGRQPSSLQSIRGDETGPGERPTEAAAWPPQVDGYDIVGRLGRGGMGVVYRARQRGLDRLVALKMLRGGDQADPETVARFRIEVRSVARLRHPNIVQVYDVGESRGLPFVALELLEGGSLDARNAGNPQPEPAAATLVATLARAIASAHRAGIVHRDLKPANVLFTRDGIPKVTDFGLAKRLDVDDGQTQSGQVMGSPSFMAPEQARGAGGELGAADLYSLGAILYEMLTGRPPFKGSSPIETLRQVVHSEPVLPSKLRPGLSRDLETICLKCLRKEPAQRYPTADDLADDLHRFLAGSPIRARRVHALERGWKWAKREPASAALIVLLGVCVVSAGGIGSHRFRAMRLHTARVADLQAQGQRHLDEALVALHERRWGQAQANLNQSLIKWGGEPGLAALAQQAERMLAEAEAGEATQNRLDRFDHESHLAQLADAESRLGEGAGAGDPRPVRSAVEKALALIGRRSGDPADSWRADPPPSWLTAPDRAALESSALDMILLHAEATGRPAPGEQRAIQAQRALRLLDGISGTDAASRAVLDLRSRLFAELGDEQQSARLRDQAARIEPANARDQIAVGRACLLREEWSSAVAAFEAAIQLDPHRFSAQLDLGLAELRAGRPEAARPNLTVCLQREPKALGLYLLRGLVIGQEAGHRLQAAGRLAPTEEARLDAERLFRLAEADFRKAFDLRPTDSERYLLLLNRGAVRFLARNYSDAEADLSAAIRLAPDRPEARIDRGQALRRLGRTDEAVEELSRAIAIDSTRSRLYRERAFARLERRSSTDLAATEQAINDFTQAIQLGDPVTAEVADSHAQRARLRCRVGRLDEALRDADEALRVVPGHADASLVRLQVLLDLKRYPDLLQGCDEALIRRPGSAEIWELRGLARSFRQNFGDAVADFTEAIRLDPHRPSARIQRGWAYFLSDAPKLALADFDAVIEKHPDHGEAHGCRGFALASTGQFQAAVADAEASIQLTGRPEARTYYNAARIFARSAAGLMASSSSRRSPVAITQANEYQDRALALVQTAIDLLPTAQQRRFYQDVILTDPALATIRSNAQFARMSGSLGQTKP